MWSDGKFEAVDLQSATSLIASLYRIVTAYAIDKLFAAYNVLVTMPKSGQSGP